VKNVLRALGMLFCVISSGLAHATTEWSAQDYDLYSGDFNGDGKTDILYIAKSAGMPSGIAISDSSGGPNTAWQSWASDYLGINWSGNAYNVIVADFNGDHKADILLQSKTPGGDSYLLLTSSAGFVVAKLDIPNGALGFSWSADLHHIVAGDFNGDGMADLFFQATSPTGTSYVVLAADTNGTFSVAQSWTDGTGPGPVGFKWSTKNANVFAGDFNGDGLADLLFQAKPNFVMIDYDVPFPVPTYPPNMNGVVLSQGGATPFTSAHAQTWNRMANGVDWSPLTNNIIIATTGSIPPKSEVILQGKNAGSTSFELTGNSNGAVFPSTATTLSSNVSLTADSYHLIAGNYNGSTGVGLYYQALTPSGANYLTDAVAATTTASIQNPTKVTGTVEATSVGRTGGQFAVSSTGAAQYTIPIWAPPGPQGMQPNLTLIYNSHQGNGILGVGWGLSGLSSINRCNLTYAQDAAPASVALVTTDGLCLDGKRLRLTSGTPGAAGSTYQTEIADFSNVTAVGVAGNGPASFSVQARNGWTYEYGNGSNSQVLATGTSTASAWMLDKITDRAGNTMIVTYTTDPSTPGTVIPSTMAWTATSSGSSSYSYTMTFGYGTVSAQASTYRYVYGTPVINNKILESIAINYGGVIKEYFLGYQSSPTTGRYELTSVQECADSGQTNCFAPTTIAYQNGAQGLGAVQTLALQTNNSHVVVTDYDFNGDGINDLAIWISGAWWVAFGTPSGFSSPINIGLADASGLATVGDVDGSGKAGFLIPVSGVWWYYKWNGSAFAGVPTGAAVDTYTTANNSTAILADVDGDGLPDLVYLSSNGYVRVLLNTSRGAPSFSQNPINTITYALYGISALYTMPHFDSYGAGQQDVFAQIPFDSGGVALLHFSGNTFVISQVSDTPIPAVLDVGNYNDDGCQDILSRDQLTISGCGASAAVLTFNGDMAVAGIDWDGSGRRAVLVNHGGMLGVYKVQGTGLSSLIPTSIPYSSAYYYKTSHNATGDGLDALVAVNSSFTAFPLQYYPHNGSGQLPDLATSFKDGYGNSASPSYGYLGQAGSLYLNFTDATFPYKNYIGPMSVVSQTTFSDASSAPGGTYTQTMSYYGAWMNLQGRGFAGFNDIGNLDSRNGVWDVKFYRRDFPYTGMLSGDWISQPNTVATFSVKMNNAFPTLAAATLDGTANNQRYFPYVSNSTTSNYELGGSESGDLITTTSTTYTFDNYGNATNIVKTLTDNDPGSPYSAAGRNTWTTNITNTTDISVNQAADLAAWCLNMLDQTQVTYTSTLPGSTSVTRTKMFTPDTPSACRIKTVITEPMPTTNPYKVTEALTFDGFGNVQTDTITGNNMPSSPASRVTTLNWGTTGQFLNSMKVDTGTVANPTTATTTWAYSSNQSLTFGVPDSVTNPNSLRTSWTYDAFGRKSKETRPDSTLTTWTWNTCSSFCGWSNSVYQVAQTNYQANGSTVIRTDTNFYDSIDRVTETSGPTVTGSNTIVQNLYNSLGLLRQQSLPRISGATAYQKSYLYDGLNRLTSVSRPISSTKSTLQSTNYGYAGRTFTVKDPYGNAKTTITDVNGWLRQTKDAMGYTITLTFDAAGSLIGVTDSVGNTLLSGVSYAYGLKPFRTAATDADRGAWTYTVDSLGERTSWTDAKSPAQSFTMTYDALSRPLTRTDPITATDPGLFTQWQYGSTPASHNVGQLIMECSITGNPNSCGASPQYLETRAFDSIGRLSTRAISEAGVIGNDPGGVFLFTTAYDATTGLLNSLTYPISTSGVAALNVQYGYQNGLLQSVTDTTDTTSTCGSTCTLWTANAMNAFGKITQETLGNGVVTNRTYDAVTSWLSGATAGVGGGAALLNQSYLEDENGNVTQRQQNNTPGITESFGYDADNRLTCTALASTCTTPTLVYDSGTAGPGNITSQTGVGTYTYPAAGQPRPHAVTSVTGTFNGSFSYDANGNMTNRASSTPNVAWSSYNYPVDISANDATGAEEVHLSYGPDRQRWKQIYTGGPTGTETTYYIGGLVDLVFIGGVANYRHYVNAGGEPVAVYNRTAAGNTMSYMLEDHQGGVSAIASNSGTADVNESFSAFGNRRDSGTWSGPPSTPDLNKIAGLTRQGYTFQTSLGQSMGLNHMNGRVEDAILGRFLSPDPHVPDPSNPQSYNRYSYVNNNPLSLVDPSGFDDEDPYANSGDPQRCEGNCDANGNIVVNGRAGADTIFTGSNIPGVNGLSAASCFGSCAGFNNTYNGVGGGGAGYWQAHPGENLTVQSADGTSTPYNYGLDQVQDPKTGAVVGELVVEAHPYTWVDTSSWDFSACNGCNNLAAFARGATHYNINRVLLQFTALSMVPPAAFVAGPPVLAALESGGTMVTAGAKQLAQRQLLKMILNGTGDLVGAPSVEAQGMSPEVAEIVQQLTEQAEKLSQAMEIAEYWEL